ncbi:MAG: dienelactone hydrolase family protein [Promicromonosporaceae bacterium]|nr:dienelactone hydrolase family protein [Promicromonosporaceae bacterium]
MTEFRDRLRQLLGPLPAFTPLNPYVEYRADLGDVYREQVCYNVEPGERVRAYLFTPKGLLDAERRPAVLAHHQHNDEFQLGKSEVAGLAGHPDQAYALELARRGFVVLAPDALGFEERGPYAGELAAPVTQTVGGNRERFEFTRRVLNGSCLQAKLVSDMQRGLDYLQTRPEVDGGRLGAIGHSLGGQQTLFLAALDNRVQAGVSSCGFSSLRSVLREGINHNFGAYVPGLLAHGDVGDVLRAVAPRPFLALNGSDDPIFPIDGLYDSYATAQPAYEEAGHPERLRVAARAGGHAFTPEMRDRAYAWLERWL